MRNTNKAALHVPVFFPFFFKNTSSVPKGNAATVIDGSFLLKIVPWERENYSVI